MTGHLLIGIVRRLPTVAGATIALLIISNSTATACTLPFERFLPKPQSLAELMASQELVFIGTVTAIETRRPHSWSPITREIAILKVEKMIKGEPAESIEIPQGNGGACTIELNVGDRWLIAEKREPYPLFFLGVSTNLSQELKSQAQLPKERTTTGLSCAELRAAYPEFVK